MELTLDKKYKTTTKLEFVISNKKNFVDLYYVLGKKQFMSFSWDKKLFVCRASFPEFSGKEKITLCALKQRDKEREERNRKKREFKKHLLNILKIN